jgi:Arc/MetJ family transcription regulator
MPYFGMHRTTIVIDPKKLAKARRVLGTKGVKDTVERAIDEVIAADLRRQAFERLRRMEGLELDKAEVMAEAWR